MRVLAQFHINPSVLPLPHEAVSVPHLHHSLAKSAVAPAFLTKIVHQASQQSQFSRTSVTKQACRGASAATAYRKCSDATAETTSPVLMRKSQIALGVEKL